MRHVQLRRVHGPPEWRIGEELLGPRSAGRRGADHHHRGHGERGVAPAAAGVPRRARAAVRLLHARHDHGRGRPAAQQSAPERPGDPGGARRQPLPVHRIREHRPRRPARGGVGSHLMTAETQAPQAELGKARLRKEDARLVTGQTNWTDNIVLPGMLHMAFVRSPMAHARITSVDLSAARAAPGVIAAFSGADFADEQGSMPCVWPVTPDIVMPNYPAMAVGEVHYVGDIVACVIARDRYAAADGAAAVDVSYEPQPAVLDMRQALSEGSPKVHEAGNKCYEWVLTNGDIDAAFRDAAVVIERDYVQQRLIPSPMEPRATVAMYEADEVTLWSATQIPHIARVLLALTTGIPEQDIRVIAPDVGGGFGSKLEFVAEEVLTVLAARKVGRPVKWAESRSESAMASHHGRDQLQRIRIAADADGRIRGLSVDLLANMGAYLKIIAPGIPILGAFMYNAIYKMDALSFRKRNWISHEEFPFTTIAGLTYDSGNYEAATARAMELFGYDALRQEQT